MERERAAQARARTGPEKKMEEKEKRKESMQKLRSIASPEEKKARLAMERKRLAQARAAESPEETAARQAMDMERSAQARAAESPEETAARQAMDRERAAQARARTEAVPLLQPTMLMDQSKIDLMDKFVKLTHLQDLKTSGPELKECMAQFEKLCQENEGLPSHIVQTIVVYQATLRAAIVLLFRLLFIINHPFRLPSSATRYNAHFRFRLLLS